MLIYTGFSATVSCPSPRAVVRGSWCMGAGTAGTPQRALLLAVVRYYANNARADRVASFFLTKQEPAFCTEYLHREKLACGGGVADTFFFPEAGWSAITRALTLKKSPMVFRQL